MKDTREKRLYDTYGLTLKEYQKKYKEQKGCCKLCGNYYKVLNVDHRHVPKYKKLSPEDKIKEVRDLLCMRCNKFTVGGIEIHKQARKILEAVNIYFTKYPLKGD